MLLPGFTPFQLTAGRYLAYGLMALVLAAPAWRGLRAKATKADWLALIWLSLAGNIVYFLLLAVAIQKAGPALASLIVGLVPVVVSLSGDDDEGHVRLRDQAGPLALIVAGVAAINADVFLNHGAAGGAATSDLVLGVACAVGALLSWTLYAVGNARHLKRHHHFTSHEWSLLNGVVTGLLAVLLVPALVVSAPGAAGWAMFWGVSAATALGASLIGNALWNGASRLLPMSFSGQLIVFETLFALLYGFVLQHRLPRGLEVLAIALLIGGVLWSARLHRPMPIAPA